MLFVNDLMNSEPRTLRPDDSLNDAAKVLWEGKCGGLPVVDDERHPVGFLTDRDIAMSGAIQGLPLHELDVSSSMTGRCVTVPAGATAGRLQELMREHRVTRLPVVNDDGALVGLVTVSDLVSHVAAQSRTTKLAGEVRQTLGELSHSGLRTRTAATNGKVKTAGKPTAKATVTKVGKAKAGKAKAAPATAGAKKTTVKVSGAKAKATKAVKAAKKTATKTVKKAVRKTAATRVSGQGFLPLTARKTGTRRKAKAPARRAAKGRSAGA